MAALSADGKTVAWRGAEKEPKNNIAMAHVWEVESLPTSPPKPSEEPKKIDREGAKKAPGPEDLRPDDVEDTVVEAWRKVGAEIGWHGQHEFGIWLFSEAKPNGHVALKAFRWDSFEPGVIVKLPERVAKEEVRGGKAAVFTMRGRPSKAWIKYSPRNTREAGRLAPILEVAARYVVEAA